MKRTFLFIFLALVSVICLMAQKDWRKGIWYKDVPEHFLTLDIGGTYVITENYKEMNPYGLSAQLGYQYKMRPFVKNRLNLAFGGHIGYTKYLSNNATAMESDFVQEKYKSYAYIPLMLNATLYFNMKRSYIFMGIDAGVNLMLYERDYQGNYNLKKPSINNPLVDTVINYQATYFPVAEKNNPFTLSRVVPSARVFIGYMHELTQNIRLRIKAGIEYDKGYEFDYQAMMLNGSIQPATGKITAADNLDPFFMIGLVYSL